MAARRGQSWTDSPAFITWMTGCILAQAGIGQGDRVAEIGCGTGVYSRALAARAGRVICADSSQTTLGQLPGDPAFIPVLASVEDIAAGRTRLPGAPLDVIVVREVLHHVAADDRRGVMRGLAGLLNPAGRIVVITMPQQLSHPLFNDARYFFEDLQPDPADIAAMLSDAGLGTELTCESFPVSLPKDRYLRMIADRYLSVLDDFDASDFGCGEAYINFHHPGDQVEFPDQYAFIRGTRG